jgi:glycosyltransferase
MIDIIVPSFKDLRIIRTIQSIRLNKAADQLRIIIIDGGSDAAFIQQVSGYLRQQDILISERDKGIFDALNKGLDLANAAYLYWLGSDDFINPAYDFSEAIDKFEQDAGLDCICYKTVFFDKNGLTRSLHINKPDLASYRMGFHLPHFSTIWRRSSIGDIRFDLSYRISADYDFFFKVFESGTLKVESNPKILVFMQEGGNSTRGIKQQWKGFKDVSGIHLKHTSWPITFLAMFNRYFFKIVRKQFGPKIKEVSVMEALSSLIIHSHP